MDITPYNEKNTHNFKLFSNIPDVCKSEPCVLGIDEAGRGPVLGPMVYGIAFCPVSKNGDLKALGVDDSKALSEDQREKLLQIVLDNNEYIGWAVDILSPSFISTSMNKRGKYNLNAMSHDTAINLVKDAIQHGVNVSEVYVDTVGPPEKYQAKLEGIFPNISITVAKKADSLYPCVSAASICAKVARDHALRDWTFPEGGESGNITGPWGSGYPADPVTKKFLQEQIHPIFGFPGIVRFSWKTAEKIMEEKGVKVEWEEVEPEEEENKNPSVSQYFVTVAKSKKGEKKSVAKMHPYFRERCLTRVEQF